MLPNPGFGAKKRAAETATAPSVKRNGIETESAPGPSGEIVFCADIARSSRRSSSPTGKCIKTGPADANRRLDSAMPSRSAAACANPCAAAVERSPRPAQPEPAVISSLDPAPVQTFLSGLYKSFCGAVIRIGRTEHCAGRDGPSCRRVNSAHQKSPALRQTAPGSAKRGS